MWIPTLSYKILKSKNSRLRFAECRAENTALHHPGGATTPYALYTHPKRLTLPAMGTCCTSTRTKHDRVPFHACMPSSSDQCICCARNSKELPTVAPRARSELAGPWLRERVGPKDQKHAITLASVGAGERGIRDANTPRRHFAMPMRLLARFARCFLPKRQPRTRAHGDTHRAKCKFC